MVAVVEMIRIYMELLYSALQRQPFEKMLHVADRPPGLHPNVERRAASGHRVDLGAWGH